jgi:hypothetical protein
VFPDQQDSGLERDTHSVLSYSKDMKRGKAPSQYTGSMQSRASRITVTIVLLICLVCPLLEMFDQWDDTIQTGNDTEYGLVVLALCVGVAYSFAQFIFKYSLRGFLAKNALTSRVHKSFRSTPCSFVPLLFNPLSPPTLALRI